MTKLPLSIFLLAVIPIIVISHILNSQQSTLLFIKQQWGHPQALTTWNPTTSPCSWYGIQCSNNAANSTRVVTKISLFNATISSSIPPSICELKTLKILNLTWNNIPNNFPTALRRCSALTTLDLSANLFVGTLPDDVDKLLPPSLQYLNLNENNFTGNIPKSITTLKELRTLYLSYNLLNGTYPSEISNLSKLEDLQMDSNPFTPMALPSEWGNLNNLKILIMRGCNLVGQIPESFGELSSLEHLDLSENGLVGTIPDGLFSLKSLSFLDLHGNKLYGEIPNSIHSLNLSLIDLYNNKLSGSIPEDFGKLRRLKDLSLFMNSLSGGIPSSIGLLPELEILKVFNNNLSGPLPPELGLHSKLRILEIGRNRFSGPLPENLCSKGALKGITAFSNHLSGEIPTSLGHCTTLTTLMIYDNSFTGEIPVEVWTLPAVYSLMFSFNGFTGSLPDKISENMTSLEVDNNKFTGQIPNGIASWTNIQVFSAEDNFLSGTLPLGLISLPNLEFLFLDGNQLSGELPPLNINKSALTFLALSRNKFSGPIPAGIASLTNLRTFLASDNLLSGGLPLELTSLPSIEILSLDGNQLCGELPPLNINKSWTSLTLLDLSSNEFSGPIPAAIGSLPSLIELDLSSNNLSGEIPHTLDNKTFEESFLNNANLCTSDNSPIVTLHRCSSLLTSSSTKHLSSEHLAMIIFLAVIVFLMTFFCTVFAKESSRRKHKDEQLPRWKFTPFQMLHFTEANIITSLSEQHVIGSGGSGKVYSVQVDNNSGYTVAVKRIWNNRQVNNAQFLAEVEILGKIRHANIVKLLCCISNENTKLLVYEYMENQSLDRWLHKKRRLESERRGNPLFVLNWPTRLRIATGAAQGLCYMHHDCGPPIIHRDVKSSNILLDSEFNAKIADFGLARMLVKQGELHTMSSVAGSFGYLAPEYQNTRKVTEKIDVYSFGVVLLELVTGKEPNSRDETLNLADSSWRHCCEDKPIVDGLDEEVIQEEYIEQMSSVFKLGLMCTSPLPNSRPSMKDVLRVLRRSSPVEEAEHGNLSSEQSAGEG